MMTDDELLVTVDGVRFVGQHDPALSPFEIKEKGLTGWKGGVGMRRELTPLATAHGAASSPGYLEPRIVTLEGFAHASSMRELANLGRRFAGILAGGSSTGGTIAVEHQGESLWATAHRHTPDPIWEEDGGVPMARYQLQLICFDPRQYGQARSYGPGTTLQVSHAGSFPAHPVVTVTATSAISTYGLRLVQDGVQLGYLRLNALAAGKTHVIDMRSGFVALDGAVTDRQIHSGAPWAIPPCSECTVTLEPVTGAGTVALAFSDTYI